MPRPFACVAAIAAVVALSAVAPPAQAFRTTAQAVSICQAALPAFEGLIRKRPLAIQNEGASPAFVTCAFANTGQNVGTHRINSAEVFLQNLGTVGRTVECTAVNSDATTNPSPIYLVKSANVAAGATVQLAFASAEFPGAPILLPGNTVSVSCNLPAGVGITGTVLQNNAA